MFQNGSKASVESDPCRMSKVSKSTKFFLDLDVAKKLFIYVIALVVLTSFSVLVSL